MATITIRPSRFTLVLGLFIGCPGVNRLVANPIEPGFSLAMSVAQIAIGLFWFGVYLTNEILLTPDVTVMRFGLRQRVHRTADIANLEPVSSRPIAGDGQITLPFVLDNRLLRSAAIEVRGGEATEHCGSFLHGRIRHRSSADPVTA